MATSGSTNFNQTAIQIATRALRMVGAIGQGETLDASQTDEAFTAMNTMIKNWQTEGIRLWTLDWKTKTFTASDEVVGSDSKNYTCIKSHTSASSNKPVTGADWTEYWVEKNSSGSTWVTSTAYNSTGDFSAASDTIGIQQAFMRNGTTDSPLEIISWADYMNISDKATFGTPDYLLWDEKLAPKIFLYPILDDMSYVLHYLRIRSLEDFDTNSDNPDFPVKWIEPIVFGLAYKLSIEYGLSLKERDWFKIESERLRLIAKANDREKPEYERIAPSYEDY